MHFGLCKIKTLQKRRRKNNKEKTQQQFTVKWKSTESENCQFFKWHIQHTEGMSQSRNQKEKRRQPRNMLLQMENKWQADIRSHTPQLLLSGICTSGIQLVKMWERNAAWLCHHGSSPSLPVMEHCALWHWALKFPKRQSHKNGTDKSQTTPSRYYTKIPSNHS